MDGTVPLHDNRNESGTKQSVFADVGGSSIKLFQNDRLLRSSATKHGGLPRNDIFKIITTLPRKPEALIIGMRGVWTPAEKRYWQKRFKNLAGKVVVMSDIELAHLRAFGKKPGIILNAGTGSIAYGRSASGKTARAGGLGPLLGDEGSGFWIGREYLKRVKKANWPTLRALAVRPTAVRDIAAYARQALRDPRAKPIIKEAKAHLNELVRSVQKQLKWQGHVNVKTVGGLFKNKLFRNFI